MAHERTPATGLALTGIVDATAATSTPVKISLFRADTWAAYPPASADRFRIMAIMAITGAAGDVYVYWDISDLASAEAIVDADAGANTFAVAGDRSDEFASGRTFTVANSTGNDAAYTSTGATYDAATAQTTITVASVADGTDDGDITSDSVMRDGSQVVLGNFAANGGETRVYPENNILPVGRQAYTLYVQGVNTGDIKVHADLLRTVEITKTGPAGHPRHNPQTS